MKAAVGVVNFICEMHEAQSRRHKTLPITAPVSSHKKVLVVTQVNHNIHSIFMTSELNKTTQTTALVPLEAFKRVEGTMMPLPSVVSRAGNRLKITSQKSGHSTTYRLPKGCFAYTQSGDLINKKEHMATRVILKIETTLKPYQEKIFEVVRQVKEDCATPTHIQDTAPFSQSTSPRRA
jgi:hypothetical protein